MRRGRRWLVGAGAAVFIVLGAALSAAVAQRQVLEWGLIGLLAVWLPVWVAGALLIRRLPGRWALVACVLAAVAIRAAALTGTPVLTDDHYRYAWDAKVQLSGVDPYERAPLDPELIPLRERWLFPDLAETDATRINRPDVRTIYPPLAQAWFVAVRVVTGGAAGEWPWQAAAAVIDLGLCALLASGLRRLGHDPRLAAWWCLSPLAAVELVNNAHVDGLAIALSVAAVVVARRRPGLAGGLVGAAAMVKFYPALLLLAVGRRRPFLVGGAFAAVCSVAYLPHVLAVGPKVLGYLPGYLREEGYDKGGRFLLLSVTGLPSDALPVLAALVMMAAAALVWRGDLPAVRAAPLLLGMLLLVTTPVQPWYAVSVAALGLLDRAWWWAVLAVVAWPYYVAIILDDPRAESMGRAGYALALAAILAAALTRRRREAAALPDDQVVGPTSPAAVAS
ncbi:MAG: glycosyltransferase 87 family protein [Acidimicrobiales bacterium]